MVGEKEESYDVKKSLVAVLFHPKLQHNLFEIRQADEIAKKVESAKDEVLLEEAEYKILKSCLEKINGYSREDLEFITRVMDAKQIEVVESSN